MKKVYLILFVVLIGSANAKAQTDLNLAKIVQACIDLPDLQNLYPNAEDGTPAAVHIMQLPIAMPTDLPVKKFGKELVYMNRPAIYGNQVRMYFLFQTLDITSTSANVQFVCYYNQASPDKGVMTVSLSLTSSGGNWTITTKEITKY